MRPRKRTIPKRKAEADVESVAWRLNEGQTFAKTNKIPVFLEVSAKSKENLDMDLDQYMAKSKGHLDNDLDQYMAQANSASAN